MSMRGPAPDAPETVLAGRGTTARFDGQRLLVVRGRTTWTLPVRAVASAEATAGGTIRVGISGDPGRARHGLGRVLELPTANARAAEAFLGQLTAALTATEPAADGHALIQVRTQPPPSYAPGPRGRRAVRAGSLLAGYTLLLSLLGWMSPLEDGLAAFSLSVAGVLGLIGGAALWRTARRVRSLWLLRRRGVGVVGEADGHVRIRSEGAHLWIFSKLTFTTVDGRMMRGVPPVVSVRDFSGAVITGRADLVYDPEHPARASRPLTFAFVLRTVLLTALGLVPLGGAAVCLVPNLPF
ncbi:hypothetical protein [Streptomyces sp. Tu 3180]|uniref:hypothetical protein n=1 Tax=Streptomyces sp. Tu 3180 TaxID=2682611 RepID=UPI00135CC0CE|nr:hypothetical protein [Streptomyces sp. Tu 3180]KAF3463567.1 hypothetical protein GL259_04035 [Streptomyces sp. Tu 3180]